MILSCHGIHKSFGEDCILSDVTFQIEKGDKLAVVGNNGTGKSTLLKIIMHELEADGGDVVLAKDATIGYLAQYQDLTSEYTVYESVYLSSPEILRMQERLVAMEAKMSQLSGEELERLLTDYHSLQDTFTNLGGYAYESEVQGVLRGLGFSDEDFTKKMYQLSGGQKTRVSLGSLLVKKPDILLLDEPINHLDLASIEWLETFLMNYKGTVVIVAHDRYFLDRVVTKVLDLSHHKAHLYNGNYTAYTRQKELSEKTLLRAYEKQQAAIAHEEEVIGKLKQFNREKSIKRAESREKALERMERIDKPLEEADAMHLSLSPESVSGNDVLELIGLEKSYDGKLLFSDVNFLLRRGEHVAILGDNGTGKTTLLKIINGKVPASNGTYRLGSNVTVGYYDQEQQELDDTKTLFEEMSDAYPKLPQTKIRNVLAAFLFVEDDCYKRISELSGGERGRISLAKLMLSGANFLILDEPTNHLDMESKGILEHALNSYDGTVLYVSHDRYFVNQTAHKILELSNGSFHTYLGNYDYYLEKKSEASGENDATEWNTKKNNDASDALVHAAAEDAASSTTAAKMDWQQQKKIQSEKRKVENRIAQIEEEIAACEETIASVDADYSNPENMTNSVKLNELSTRRMEAQEKLEPLMQEWEDLQMVLEEQFGDC